MTKREYHRTWRAKNRERVLAANARYRARHREQRRKDDRTRKAKGQPGWVGAENSRLKYTYGLTLEQYTAKVLLQGEVCALCGQPEAAQGRHGSTKKLCVDHNHGTDAIRDLLCDTCNRVVGIIETRAVPIDALAAYLQKWGIETWRKK